MLNHEGLAADLLVQAGFQLPTAASPSQDAGLTITTISTHVYPESSGSEGEEDDTGVGDKPTPMSPSNGVILRGVASRASVGPRSRSGDVAQVTIPDDNSEGSEGEEDKVSTSEAVFLSPKTGALFRGAASRSSVGPRSALHDVAHVTIDAERFVYFGKW